MLYKWSKYCNLNNRELYKECKVYCYQLYSYWLCHIYHILGSFCTSNNLILDNIHILFLAYLKYIHLLNRMSYMYSSLGIECSLPYYKESMK